MSYILPFADLIEQFRKLPGIGSKSAQKLAFQLLAWNKQDILKFADFIIKASNEISYCPDCFNFSANQNLCSICNNTKRNNKIICIVSGIKDLTAIERTNEYKGVYHVLHGLISPLDGISPENLKIKELIQRISLKNQKQEEIEEIILALTPSTEGEATTLYLTRLLKPLIPKITRLAFGLSVGADIEQTDELTLAKALEGRSTC